MHRSRFSAGMVAAVIACVGACLACGCRPREVLGDVTGHVTVQGQPVPGILVVFQNEAKGVFMTAQTDSDGGFRVSMAKGYGLPLGTYRVYLNPPVPDIPLGATSAPPSTFAESTLPRRYRSAATSGLTLDVKEGKNPFVIDMEP